MKLSGLIKHAMTVGLLCAVAFSNTTAASLAADEANWPGWRGPEGSGISAEKNLPEEWSATKNVKWKTPVVGKGYSSPIVWGRRVFLTTAIEGPVVAGAKAMKHVLGGKDWLHPDSVGAEARSHPHQLHRRAGLCLARHRRRQHLHPRRAQSLPHRRAGKVDTPLVRIYGTRRQGHSSKKSATEAQRHRENKKRKKEVCLREGLSSPFHLATASRCASSFNSPSKHHLLFSLCLSASVANLPSDS